MAIKKIFLAKISTISICLSSADEFSCYLMGSKTIVLEVNDETVKYAYGLPDD